MWIQEKNELKCPKCGENVEIKMSFTPLCRGEWNGSNTHSVSYKQGRACCQKFVRCLLKKLDNETIRDTQCNKATTFEQRGDKLYIVSLTVDIQQVDIETLAKEERLSLKLLNANHSLLIKT